MIEFLKYVGELVLKFVVDAVSKLTLFATLISVSACLVLFFICFFTGHAVYALLSLAGMLCFIYANKQF